MIYASISDPSVRAMIHRGRIGLCESIRRATDDHYWLYAFECDCGALKFGISWRPWDRIRSVLSEAPHRSTRERCGNAYFVGGWVHENESAAKRYERALHNTIRAHQLSGEWFRPDGLAVDAALRLFAGFDHLSRQYAESEAGEEVERRDRDRYIRGRRAA